MEVYKASFVGKNSIHFAEIDSTNTFLTSTLSKSTPIEGTCIIADFQTGGKGQIGRYWHSSPCLNLLISYVLYPVNVKSENQFFINIVSSLAVYDLLSSYGIQPRIKWPNDVYVGNQKIAGTLTQNTWRGEQLRATIIGIGLNVNETEFPTELPNPTSMSTILGKTIDIVEVKNKLSDYLEYYYLALLRSELVMLNAKYLERLYKINEWAQYKDLDENVFSALILGITKDGLLELQHADGAIEAYDFRALTFLLG